MKTPFITANNLLRIRVASILFLGLCSLTARGQSNLFAPSVSSAGDSPSLSLPAELTTPSADDALYADGTRAIQEKRWAEAASIFQRVIQMHADHAEGALYWKAYAENKQAQPQQAQATCATLRKDFPASRWLDECGALEIEIRSASGQPLDPGSDQDQQLKLLALNSLMKKDEGRALPQIQQILQGDQPETFKEKALFIVAQSPSSKAQQMLADVANSSANPTLQARAKQMLAAIHNQPASGKRHIFLDALVTDKTGKPVPGLGPHDFTVFDNGQPQKLRSFRAVGSEGTGEAATQIMILIDTVNGSFQKVSLERQWVADFLRLNNGALAHPVSILFFRGKDFEPLAPASRDGNSLAAALDKAASNLHPIRRSEAFFGALERLQVSLGALGAFTAEQSRLPGRKIVLWLGGGWPLLAGTETLTDRHDGQIIFDEIVAMSTGLRQARIILYDIDPIITPGASSLDRFRYENFIKPVATPNQASSGNLGLQVIAQQSGGRVINHSPTDLASILAMCMTDADQDYILSIEIPPAARKDEYHSVKITVNKPGLEVLTRAGYYNQP